MPVKFVSFMKIKFTIKLMESKQPTKEGPRLSSLDSLKQSVYILEKIH